MMAMFSFDEPYALFDVTPLSNQFILNYLPSAPGDAVRVYVYGLMMCYHQEADSSIEKLSRLLNLSEEEVRSAYRYWERKGLVQRVADNPPQYRYLNANQVSLLGTQVTADPEYEAFAEALYGVFDNDRRLHGKEISQCYEWVEDMHIPADVVIAMMKHLVKLHGKNVSMKTAEKLATTLAEEKIMTPEDADEVFRREQKVWDGTRSVLRKLGQRRNPTAPEQEMYRKWLLEWHFTPDGILKACDESVKSINPTFAYIDGILRRLHEKEASTEKDVARDFSEKDAAAAPLKRMLAALGNRSLTVNESTLSLYRSYQALYPDAVILFAATECAKNGRNAPQDVLQTLMNWQKCGLRTLPEIEKYMRNIDDQNAFLMTLYQAMLDEKTSPNANDRRLMTKWLETWQLSSTFVLGCAPWAAGKEKPIAYLDKMLESFHQKGIVTMEAAKAEHQGHQNQQKTGGTDKSVARQTKVVGEQQYTQRTYTPSDNGLDEMMAQWQEENHA